MTRNYLSGRHFPAKHVFSKDTYLIRTNQTKTFEDKKQNNKNNRTNDIHTINHNISPFLLFITIFPGTEHLLRIM
jgi:hypothetical protein